MSVFCILVFFHYNHDKTSLNQRYETSITSMNGRFFDKIVKELSQDFKKMFEYKL